MPVPVLVSSSSYFRCVLRGSLAFVSPSLQDGIKVPPFNHNVHHRGLWTEAAYGSLKPPPTRRLRRTSLHLSYSMTITRLLDTSTASKVARKRGDERRKYRPERQSINERQPSIYQSNRNLREPHMAQRARGSDRRGRSPQNQKKSRKV